MHILVTVGMLEERNIALEHLYKLRELLEDKARHADAHYTQQRMVPLNRVAEAVRALERWDTVDDEAINGP